MVEGIVDSQAPGAGAVVRPQTLATAGRAFAVAFMLAAALLLFLLVRSRMNDRDSKSRSALRSSNDPQVAFEEHVR